MSVKTMRMSDVWVHIYAAILVEMTHRGSGSPNHAAEQAALATDAAVSAFRKRYQWESGFGFTRIPGTDLQEDETPTIVWPSMRSAPDERALLLCLAQKLKTMLSADTAFIDDVNRLIAILEKPFDARAVRFRE